MTASAEDLHLCVLQLRTLGWDAAAPTFLRLSEAIPASLDPVWAQALARLLRSREALDPLEAADLLEGELARIWGASPRPAEAGAADTPETLRIDGRRLLSARTPQREAALQLRHVQSLPGPQGIVLLGAAGTPLAEELAKRGDTPLHLWEPEGRGRDRARALAREAGRDVVVLDDESSPPAGKVSAWIHPSLQGDDRDRAWSLVAALRVRAHGPARPARRGRVILLDRGRPFHGEADLCDALEGAGRSVQVRSISGGPADEATVEALLAEAPEFVLSVNGAALTLSPLLRECLAAASIPTVLWFVDDPEVAMREPGRFAGPHVLALAWERAAVAQLRAWGFSGAGYLPHATRLARERKEGVLDVKGDLVWAASSYAGRDREHLAAAAGSAPEWIEAFARQLLQRPHVHPRSVRRALLELPEAAGLREDATRALFVQVAACDRATALHRAALARQLIPEGLQLYGDEEGWKRSLGEDAPVLPSLHPIHELPRLYAPGRICVDLAHAQMPTALTQRAFDTTGSGALLLADDRPDLREHFDVGSEVLAFAAPEEARDLVRWCRNHPDAANAIAERGFLRTRREHRWSRRVRTLLQRVADRFGS